MDPTYLQAMDIEVKSGHYKLQVLYSETMENHKNSSV